MKRLLTLIFALAMVATFATAQAQDAKPITTDKQDAPKMRVEIMPTFRGGNIVQFGEWVQNHLHYPKEAKQKRITGRVMVAFVVERDGTLSNIEVLSSPHESLSTEVVRVMNMSPKWKPAKQHGEVVRVRLLLPVIFNLPNPGGNKVW